MLLQRLSLLLVLMCSRPKSGHSTLITYSRDTEVLVNQSTYFNCSTSILSEQIHWYHNRVGENQTNYVYYKGQFNQFYADRYSIEKNINTGEYNLIIRSAQHGDSGRYVCQDDGGLGDLGSAELIVIESTPTCVFSMKSNGFVGPNSCYIPLETLQLSCSVSYIGNIPPILQWKIDGNDAPILEGITTDYSGKHATVNLSTNSTVEMDGDVFTCGTTRSHDKKLSCTTDTVNIDYAIAQPTILSITKGENITCSANASVQCTYRWFYDNDTQYPVSYNQVLTTNRLGSHSCEANCPINGISCTFVAIRISVIGEEKSKDTNKALLIIILIPTVVILLIITCVLFFKLGKGQTKQPPSTADEQIDKISGSNINIPEHVYNKAEAESLLKTGSVTTDEVTPPNESKSVDNEAENETSVADFGLFDNNIIQPHIKEHVISTKASREMGRAIAGVAVLEDTIYVVSQLCSEVELFDIKTNEFTTPCRRTVKLVELENPWDLTSCKLNKYLFIMDRRLTTSTPKLVIRVDSNVKSLVQWSTGDEYGNLSVTREGNVVAAFSSSRRLVIYGPDGTEPQNAVPLSKDVIDPSHALKLNNGQFLICHGITIKEGDIHRVCIVNENGEITKSSFERMYAPSYLVVDKSGFIFVADQGNKRVIVLNSDLELIGEVASKQNRLQGPQRLFLQRNRTTAQLFVVDNTIEFENRRREGKVLIFTYCRPNHNK